VVWPVFEEFLMQNNLHVTIALRFILVLVIGSVAHWAAGEPAAPVPRTGQTTCYDQSGVQIACTGTGQDGDKQAGVPWPDPRFVDNGDGTVLDNLTGLIWLKNANCFGKLDWQLALNAANALATGQCGLTDGSVPGQWRLPNLRELHSLIDYERLDPALPAGHPFSGVQGGYWSSSSTFGSSEAAWIISIADGTVALWGKTIPGLSPVVWPVRGGQ
jgi:hypothetical protein